MTTSTTEYYLLIPIQKGKSLKQLKEKFREMGGFYNSIGYCFPKDKEGALRELLSPLKVTPLQIELQQGESFDSLKSSNTADFLSEKLIGIEKEFREQLAFKNLSEDEIEGSTLPKDLKNQLLSLRDQRDDLKSQITWNEGMATIANSQSTDIKIEFISERPINFLLESPPKVPRLIDYVDQGGKACPFIRKGITAMVCGAGGVGKTHLLAQLALSIVTGRNFLDIYPIHKPGHVFMGLGENAEDDIHRLLYKLYTNVFVTSDQPELEEAQKVDEIGSRLAVMSFTGRPASFLDKQGNPTKFYNILLEQLKTKEPEEGWDCIILDPISRFLGADAEVDNAAATAFIELLERFTLELKGKPTVIFGHHMNKSALNGNTDQGAARGSSALTDGVRWQANLERIKTEDQESSYDLNKILFKPVKSNFTVLLEPQELAKDKDGVLRAIPTSHTSTNNSSKSFKKKPPGITII